MRGIRKDGMVFGNPEFVRYNAEATLDPMRIFVAFSHRLLHLTAHMNMFVPVLMTVAAMLWSQGQTSRGRRALQSAARFCAAF